jgi:hypothetical protein
LKQKEIDFAVVAMQIFLSGLTFTFDANFHELEEITKRTLLEIDVGASR